MVEDVEMPKAQVTTEEPAAPLDAEVVDKKLEEVAEPEPVAEPVALHSFQYFSHPIGWSLVCRFSELL